MKNTKNISIEKSQYKEFSHGFIRPPGSRSLPMPDLMCDLYFFITYVRNKKIEFLINSKLEHIVVTYFLLDLEVEPIINAFF